MQERRSNTLTDHEHRIRTLEEHTVKMATDMEHIKHTLSNGLMKKIDQIAETLNEFIPSIKNNTFWIDKFVDMAPQIKENTKWTQIYINWFKWVSVVAFSGGVIRIFWVLIENAIKT